MALEIIGPGFGRTGTNSSRLRADCRMSERDHATQVFRDHVAEVQSEIPKHRLLTFDLRDGWQPLCDFLEVDIPEMPFPKTNSSEEFVNQEWKQGEARAATT